MSAFSGAHWRASAYRRKLFQNIFVELNMYINCKLVATTESDDQCISCHTSGCHSTDSNTKLVLGRANSDPQTNFARFKAGDLSIYERYLKPQDIDKICGFSKRKFVYCNIRDFKIDAYMHD